jgi:hypothetical protein
MLDKKLLRTIMEGLRDEPNDVVSWSALADLLSEQGVLYRAPQDMELIGTRAYLAHEAALLLAENNMARDEIENMYNHHHGYAPAPVVPEGQEAPPLPFIVRGNWNSQRAWVPGQGYVGPEDDSPALLGDMLEALGVELEWSDCTAVCDNCYRVVHTEPTHYFDAPFYHHMDNGDILCNDCWNAEQAELAAYEAEEAAQAALDEDQPELGEGD